MIKIDQYERTAGSETEDLHLSYLDYLINNEGVLRKSSTYMRPLKTIEEIDYSNLVDVYQNSIDQVDSQTPNLQQVINDTPLSSKFEQEIYPRPDYLAMPSVPTGTNDIVLFDTVVDRVQAISLSCPNRWSATEAVGKSFDWFHSEVTTSQGKPVIPTKGKLSGWIAKQEKIFERVGASSFQPCNSIALHPDDRETWMKFDDPDAGLFFRFERQIVIPLQWGFLFLIRTNLVNCLDHKEIFHKVIHNQENLHSYPRWTFEKYGDAMKRALDKS